MIPWKFGEEENVERFMPMNVLLGRESRRIVPTLASRVGWDMVKSAMAYCHGRGGPRYSQRSLYREFIHDQTLETCYNRARQRRQEFVLDEKFSTSVIKFVFIHSS